MSPLKFAIYPGTFNPWTKSHQNILDRALTIFDKVTIVVAKNPSKEINIDVIHKTLIPIQNSYRDEVTVIKYDGLVSDFKCPIIRGVRSGDWEYEQNLANWNMELGVETIFLCPAPEYSHINSTALRSLYKHGKNIDKFIGNKKSFELWKRFLG